MEWGQDRKRKAGKEGGKVEDSEGKPNKQP